MSAMLAIEISRFGPPDVLKPAERPKPSPAHGEVVIRVAAAGIARADSLQRQGKYPPPPGASDIPGLDVSGVVDSVGPGVEQFNPGDRVCAILTGGGYAEFCSVPAVQVLPVPEGWTFTEAATLPENLFTVFDNVVTRGRLARGESILIHGGTSGIGTTAIMVALAVGAVPFATAGSREKCEASLELGATQAFNYKETDFVEQVNRTTANRGVNVVLDVVGGPYLNRNIECLAVEGRLGILATLGGHRGELDIRALMRKRATVFGSTMRNRTPEEKGAVGKRLYKEIWPLLPAKSPIRPVIDSTFPLTDASAAHERLESGKHIGKIVLTVADL